jgi:hypothetical protein
MSLRKVKMRTYLALVIKEIDHPVSIVKSRSNQYHNARCKNSGGDVERSCTNLLYFLSVAWCGLVDRMTANPKRTIYETHETTNQTRTNDKIR